MRIMVLTLCLVALAACRERVYTVKENFSYSCELPFGPTPPTQCFGPSLQKGRFYSLEHFNSCRATVNNFVAAYEEWGICASQYHRSLVQEDIKQISDFFDCGKSGLSTCDFPNLQNLSFTRVYFSTPACMSLEHAYPTDDVEWGYCLAKGIDLVNRYRDYEENKIQEISLKVSTEISEAIERFNCTAKGRGGCF